jgi:hypothetical protein
MKQVTDVDSMAFNVVIASCGDIDNPNWCNLPQKCLREMSFPISHK